MQPVQAPSASSAEALLAGWPTGLLIDGVWQEAQSGQRLSVRDPATGRAVAEVACAGVADVDEAVRAASRASSEGRWSRLRPSERSRILWRVGELVEREASSLAAMETLDNGKPLRDATAIDVPQAAAHFFYNAGWCTKLAGETVPVSWPGHLNYTIREPIGVVAAIIPWNFPLVMAARNLAPALACGNCVILKPSEETPLTALRLGQLMQEAGVPDGVVSILPGTGDEAGAALVAHPVVRKVSFIGGQEAARRVVAASAGNFKRLSLELGGKAPLIIFADADLDRAAAAAVHGSLSTAGQNCCAAARVFVEQPVAADFVKAVAAKVEKLTVGSGFSPVTDVGPLISAAHRGQVEGHIQDAVRAGCEVVVGGGRPGAALADGYFLEPTVLASARDDMRISREEVFGPVVVPYEFGSESEVVARSNATEYGLAAGVWTGDLARAHRVAHELKVGTVWLNCYECFDSASPFGGVKQSGHGRDMGRDVLEEYTEVKSVWVDYSKS